MENGYSMSDTLEKSTLSLADIESELLANPSYSNGAFGGFQVGYGPTPPVSTVNVGAIGAGGASGSLLTANGYNGSSWSISPQPAITVGTGITKITSPLEVNGRDILKELDEMRDALLLLKRDVNMEEKYPKLKELKDAYERALEKYKTFDAIKDSK